MKIVVIGAGAIGCCVAGYLKKAGEDVLLIGRQDQVDAINYNGLTIEGIRGTEMIRLPAAVKMLEPADLVIFAVKTQDIEDAYALNADFLDTGLVLTSQNGVQADNILSSHFDQDRQLSSIVMFGATYIKPGAITFNFEGDWIVGRPFTPVDPSVHKITELLSRAFKVVVSTDITGMKYLKLFVNFNNCIPALVGKSMQETFADMDLCRLSILLLQEGLAIIKEAKIELTSMPNFEKDKIFGLAALPIEQSASIMNKTLTTLSKEPLYGSVLQSIMRGKTSEIDFINGEVVHLAKHLKLPCPLNDKMVDMVHEVERTGKYFGFDQVKREFELVGVK